MEEIIISNKKSFEQKKERIVIDGIKNLFVVSDFDRTLTKSKIGNEKTSSLVAILREGNYLGEDYSREAHKLFEKYHPYEIDMEISFEEKNSKMHEWWTKHNKLFVKYGLTRKMIKDVVNKRKAGFRDGAKRFMRLLHQNNIPLVIVSASSLGADIDDYLEKNNILYKNTKIVTNYFNFDKNGRVIGAKDPVITTTNKYLAVNEFSSELGGIDKRKKNIILLGDNYEDENMANSFVYEDILKIGFLNEKIEERLDNYKEVFDVVILNDGSMEFANSLLKSLV